MNMLPDLADYLGADLEARLATCAGIARALTPTFVFRDAGDTHVLLPSFEHASTGLIFRLIFSGTASIGLTEAQERAARRIRDPFPANINGMRPVHPVHVPAFLVSERPVIARDFRKIAGMLPSGNTALDFPAFVTYEMAESFAGNLGCCLPCEAEWEYACRAMTSTLFAFGDSLPSERELDRWLCNDFSRPDYLTRNAFGLFAIYTGEFCRDEFRNSYDVSAVAQPGVHVVRGGGAFFWPWQDEEWVWCMSAMRMPSTDLYDGTCGFRLRMDLPNGL